MTEALAETAFNALLEQYYSAWFRFHPERAVQVGVAGYEDQLAPYSNDDTGALIALNEKMLSSLEELDYSKLTPDQQIDFSIIHNSVVTELHELLEHDWRYCKPQNYVPVEAVHQLLNRPVEDLHHAFKHRLQRIPEYLRGARSYIDQYPEKIPLSWLQGARYQLSSGAAFFRGLTTHGIVTTQFQNPARLQPVCEQAAIALDEFANHLQELEPKVSGDFACGQMAFERLLKNSHYLDISADDLYRFGEKLFTETRQKLEQLASELHSRGDMDELLASIRNDHPAYEVNSNSENVLSAYRGRMQKALDFIQDEQLVSVPEIQELKILDTPEFMRHEIPFAAYEEPTYKDEHQRGYYYVTPVASEGHMLEHNWVSIDLTCVHEAFPGHHLQFVTANNNTENSLPRLLNPSATMYEGWALYCEDLMQEQGFLDRPEHEFIMLRDRLWRALRVMLDVELHCKAMSIDDAAQKMCDHLSFSIDQAKADISWYTQWPTVPMSYAVGWALIKALREQQAEMEGFNLKIFHDKLLSVGSCALPLVIKHAFGEDAWQQAKIKVFG